jgi:hypothetical protein
MFDELRNELARLEVIDVQLESDERGLVQGHSLVKMTIARRHCSVRADGLLAMLRLLPDGAGERAIEDALESEASHAQGWATCR